MLVEYHRWYSLPLNQDMEFKRFGHSGKPVLVFPCSEGRFFDAENFGLVHVLSDSIERGDITLYCVDSLDNQTWFNHHSSPDDRGHRYNAYQEYILQEMVPFIHSIHGIRGIMLLGASFGAFHAATFLLKYPVVFDTALMLSGVYSLDFSVGDHGGDAVYFNDPNRFLANLSDPVYLEALRRAQIILCCGQGAWEEWSLAESRNLSWQLENKNIEHWYDEWGPDVSHDWPWWHQQVRYFLPHLDLTT